MISKKKLKNKRRDKRRKRGEGRGESGEKIQREGNKTAKW